MAAVGIEVVFTGLMLICLDGQPDCSVKGYDNTAWVVEADGGGNAPTKICGWYRGEQTRLELQFKPSDFHPGWQPLKPTITCMNVKDDVICTFSTRDICLVPKEKTERTIPNSGLESLLRLDEIDRRFVAPDGKRLEKYVSNKINFPTGRTSAGPTWSVGGKPVRWYRSDGQADEALPRRLSDRLIVTYGKIVELTLTDCGDKYPNLIVLKPKDDASILFRNVATHPPTPDYEADEEGGYDSLAYLLWYYRLGEWDTYSGECPDYGRTKKDPVLLQCVSKGEGGCASDPQAAADTRYWPPVLGGPREE